MKIRSVVLASLVALVVLSFAPTAAPAPTAARVTVTMREFTFAFSKRAVPHGVVVFKLVNKGNLPHNFKVGKKRSKIIQPGKTGTLRVTLAAGRKPYLCTLPGHAAAGMKGRLRVR